jgi:hypothetical protein
MPSKIWLLGPCQFPGRRHPLATALHYDSLPPWSPLAASRYTSCKPHMVYVMDVACPDTAARQHCTQWRRLSSAGGRRRVAKPQQETDRAAETLTWLPASATSAPLARRTIGATPAWRRMRTTSHSTKNHSGAAAAHTLSAAAPQSKTSTAAQPPGPCQTAAQPPLQQHPAAHPTTSGALFKRVGPTAPALVIPRVCPHMRSAWHSARRPGQTPIPLQMRIAPI